MTARTPEQAEANAALTEALRLWAVAYGLIGPDEFIGDHVSIVAVDSLELMDGDNPKTAYLHIESGGYLPNHQAVGLLHVGLQHLDVVEDS